VSNDLTVGTLHAALDGLSARQQAISSDIANVNTPYYRARSVDFESNLKRALGNGDDPMSVTPTVEYSDAAGGLTGNNVDLNAETVASTKTEMSYELALRAVGDHFTLLNAAIKGY
jgi:flagellar basal-body rod protein FlgB